MVASEKLLFFRGREATTGNASAVRWIVEWEQSLFCSKSVGACSR